MTSAVIKGFTRIDVTKYGAAKLSQTHDLGSSVAAARQQQQAPMLPCTGAQNVTANSGAPSASHHPCGPSLTLIPCAPDPCTQAMLTGQSTDEAHLPWSSALLPF